MRPGAVVGGKYRLTRFLGEGAMGSVWAAVHVQTGQASAVKLISGPAVMATELRARLLREAKACGRIEHANVVAVHDVGQLDDGAPFLVMQLLAGETLEARLSREGRLVPHEAARIGGQVARALSAAHAASIIHRDLKPANIFLHVERPGGQPIVKVLDFGVSKILSETAGTAPEMRATATGHAVGSPAYMSPEQAKSANKVDARSDVWALGVVLFEMLAGELPFPGETAYAVVGEILHGPIRTVLEVAPEVDERLSGLVGRCIVRDLSKRIQTADDVASELEGFVRERGRAATAAAAAGGDEKTEPLGHNRLRAAVLGGSSGLRLGAPDLDGPAETQPPPSSSNMATERPPPPAPPPPPPPALRPAPTVPSHHLAPAMRAATPTPVPDPRVVVAAPAPLVQGRPAGQLGPAAQPTLVMQAGPQTAPQPPAPRPTPTSQPSATSQTVPVSNSGPLPQSARTLVIAPGPQSARAVQYAPTAVLPALPADLGRPASPVTLPVPLLGRKSGSGTSTGPHLIQSPPSSLDPASQALADFHRRRRLGIIAGIGALAFVAMIAVAVALSGSGSPAAPAPEDPGTTTTTTSAAAREDPSSAPATTSPAIPSAASSEPATPPPSTPEPPATATPEPAVSAQPSVKPSGRGRLPKPPSTSLFPSNPG